MSTESIERMKGRMGDSLQALEKALQRIRTGRAHPSLLQGIKADYYGTDTPIDQMANISVEEGRSLVIKPWDEQQLEPIAKAIRDSDLGIDPAVSGDVVRATMPQMSEQVREEMAKRAAKEAEGARVAVRGHRRDCLQRLEEEETSQDALNGLKAEVQKHTDDFVGKVDALLQAKRDALLET